MSFPSVNPGQWAALTASYLQHPSHDPTQDQAMFRWAGQYLNFYIGGNNNQIWSSSGLAYDSDRNLVISARNGGHGDSGDNGFYHFDVDGTHAWSMASPPNFRGTLGDLLNTLPLNAAGGFTDTLGHYASLDVTGAWQNGTPGRQFPDSTHTYGGSIYMPSVGKVALMSAGGFGQGDPVVSPWNLGPIWWYDPVTKAIDRQNEYLTDPGGPGGAIGIQCVWDPQTQRVYCVSNDQVSVYDPSKSAGSRFMTVSSTTSQWAGAQVTFCWDLRRRRMIGAGWVSVQGGDSLWYYDFMQNENFATNGLHRARVTGNGWPGFPVTYPSPGMIYDPIRDKYIVWTGSNNASEGGPTSTLWSIDPDTFVASPIVGTGDLPPVTTIGVLSRLQYNIQNDCYLLFPRWDTNCYAFRHPDTSRVFAMPANAVQEMPLWARGAGPAGLDPLGSNNQWKHCHPLYDSTREEIVWGAGDLSGASSYKPTGSPADANSKSADGSNEFWRTTRGIGGGWEYLQLNFTMPSTVGVVPGFPDNNAHMHDWVNDRYIELCDIQFEGLSQPTTTITPITPTSPVPGERIFFNNNLNDFAGKWLQNNRVVVQPVNGTGACYEFIGFDDLNLTDFSIRVTARNVTGTGAKSFPAGSIIKASNAFQQYNPTGPVADAQNNAVWPSGTAPPTITGWEMDPVKKSHGFTEWRRATWPQAPGGGGSDSQSFAVFDERRVKSPAGTLTNWDGLTALPNLNRYAQGSKVGFRVNGNAYERLNCAIYPGTWLSNYTLDCGVPNPDPAGLLDAISPSTPAGTQIRVHATSNDTHWPVPGFIAIGPSSDPQQQTLTKWLMYSAKNPVTGTVTLAESPTESYPVGTLVAPLTWYLAAADIGHDQPCIDPGLGLLWVVVHAGGRFAATAPAAQFEGRAFAVGLDIASGLVVRTARLPSTYHPNNSVPFYPADFHKEAWTHFDPLSREVLCLDATQQWGGNMLGIYIHHVHNPLAIYNLPNDPGWELADMNGKTVTGNHSIIDPFRGTLVMLARNGVWDNYYLYRRGVWGPKTASAAVLSVGSLSPNSGLAGSACTINGTLFGASQGSSVVHFGGTTATPFAWSNTSISFTVPTIAVGTYNVNVTVGSSTSNSLPFTVTSNAPTITSVMPASGPVLTTVTIVGTNYGLNQLVSTLTIGGSFATVQSWTDTQIIATVPSSLGVGLKQVVVVTINGSAVGSFTVTPPAPTVDLVFNGLIRDRVGQGDTALAPDGALDGVFTATVHSAGGATITRMRLEMQDYQGTTVGIWDTIGSNPYWVLGVARDFDSAYLNDPTTMGVNFGVLDGGSVVVFASDSGGTEFLNGNFATLTITYSDGNVSRTQITLSTVTPPPPAGTVSITLLPYGLGNF